MQAITSNNKQNPLKKAMNVALVLFVVAALGVFAYSQKDHLLTFLGGLGDVPNVGEGARVIMSVRPLDLPAQNPIVANIVLDSASKAPLNALNLVVGFDTNILSVTKVELRVGPGSVGDSRRPTFETVAGTESSIMAEANSTGKLKLNVGKSYPGTDETFDPYFVIAKVTFQPVVSIGVYETEITIDRGNERGVGPSVAMTVDNAHVAHDVLDSVDRIPVKISDAWPQFNQYDTYAPAYLITNTADTRKTFITMNGSYLWSGSKVYIQCFPNINTQTNAIQYPEDLVHIREDGKQIILQVPQSKDAMNQLVGLNCSTPAFYFGVRSSIPAISNNIFWQTATGKNLSYTSSNPTLGIRLDSVTPHEMVAGAKITINGSNLQFGTSSKRPLYAVRLINQEHSITLTNVTVNANYTSLTAIIPSDAELDPGDYELQVVRSYDGYGRSADDMGVLRVVAGSVPLYIGPINPSVVYDSYTNDATYQFEGVNMGTDPADISIDLIKDDVRHSSEVVSVADLGDEKQLVTAKFPTGLAIGSYTLALLRQSIWKGFTVENAIDVRSHTEILPQLDFVNPATVEKDYDQDVTLTIQGKNLGSNPTLHLVDSNNAIVKQLTFLSVNDNRTELTASLPVGLDLGKYSLKLTLADGTTALRSDSLAVIPSVPVVSNVDPATFTVGYPANTSVTVSGKNFSSAPTLKFVGQQTYQATNVSATDKQIVATLPTLPVGTYSVIVTSSNGNSGTWGNGSLLTINEPPAPYYGSISPRIMNNDYTNLLPITVIGENMRQGSEIKFVGPVTIELVNEAVSADGTRIKAQLPSGLVVGVYNVYITREGMEPELAFSGEPIVQQGNPKTLSLTPSTLEITYPDNTPVTITGTNFRSNSKVKLIGPAEYELRNPTVNAEFTQIQAQLPSGIQPGTYKIAVYSDGGPIATDEIVFIVTETPQKVMAPIVTNTSNPKNSTQLSASWTLPLGSSAPQYYQYRILDNGNEIRAWDADKIQLATSVTAKGLTLMNGHTYTIQVRGVNSAGPGDVTTSTTVTTRSANLDYDPNEKVGLNDLQLLGRSMGRKDKPMGDINQNGIVSIDDLGILLTLWNP